MNFIRIEGVESYVPENIVSNFDLEKIVNTKDEWIRTRTGIKERRISVGENTSDIAAIAAEKVLNKCKIKAKDIELLIVATTTPDNFTPSTASIVQRKIGAANALSFDIFAACSGFLFALNIAAQFLKNGTCKNALIIGAEVLSKIIDWEDRNTCVIFGDGAGAAIINISDYDGVKSIYCGTCGEKGEFITCDAVPMRNSFINCDDKLNQYLSMNGREVFKFAVNIIPSCIDKVLKETGYTLDDIKYIVPHQANIRIIDGAAKRMNINLDKFYINLDKYGNTSSASIPIALAEMSVKELLNRGDKVIIVGFGGGLTFGAALIEW